MTAYRDAVMADSPVAFWQLGESAGTVALDETTNHNDGVYTGGYTLGQVGALVGDSDTAIALNGTTGYVTVPDIASLDLGDVVSVEAWIYFTANPSIIATIVGKGSNAYALQIATDGYIYWRQSAGDIFAASAHVLPLNAWTHVVATKNGTARVIYVNGADDTAALGTNYTLANSAVALNIGREPSELVRYLPGKIDEVAVYGTALSSTRVAAHYTAATSGGGTPPTAYSTIILADTPVAYWRLGEASGNPQDSSGNARHVTAVGGTPTYGVTGAISGDSNKAVTLNGSTGYFSVPDVGLDLADIVSVEAWVYLTANPSITATIVGKGANAYALQVDTAGYVLWRQSNGDVFAGSTSTIPLNAWVHIVATKNGTARYVYINGADVTSLGTNYTLADSAVALNIGREPSGTDRFWPGKLDEVVVYGTALSGTRALAHYEAGIGGQPPPPPVGGAYPPDTTLVYSATDGSSRPAYLTPVTSQDGTIITRITEVDGYRHAYNKRNPWNSDQTRMAVWTAGGAKPMQLLSATNYSLIRTADIPNEFLWSNLDPNKMFGFGGGTNQFQSANVLTDVRTTLHTFSGYASIDIGGGEGNLSNDDRYVVIYGHSPEAVILYDVSLDSIVATKTFTTLPDNATVSQLGAYVVLNWEGGSSDAHSGVEVWTPSGGTLIYQRRLLSYGVHGDVGIDTAGNEVWVSAGSYLPMYRLSDGTQTNLFPFSTAYDQSHISCRNVTRPGWCYVSTYVRNAGVAGSDQVVAVKMNGSGTVEVFAHEHHVYYVPGTDYSYVREPQAVPNRDGTKVAWTTEWDPNTAVYDYVANATGSGQSNSFTVDAYIKKTTASSFTANATISKRTSSTFTANAQIGAGGYTPPPITGSFTANAFIAASSTVRTATPNTTDGTCLVLVTHITNPSGVTVTKLYRQNPFSGNWGLLTTLGLNFSYTDVFCPLGLAYAYRVDEYNSSGTLVVSTTLSNVLVATDDWVLASTSIGAVRCYVGDAGSQRVRQQEAFSVLGESYLDVQSGRLLGRSGSLSIDVLSTQRAALVFSLTALANSSERVYLKSPFGEVWWIALGGPSVEYMPVGHAVVTVAFTQVGEA